MKTFHRNQKYVGMAVVNKVHKQGHHYSTLHNHPYIIFAVGISACSYLCRDGCVGQCRVL